MGGHDSATRAKARMQQVRKEMSERRALRSRNRSTARQRSVESFHNQGQVAEQVSKHLNELGKRRKQAGGWGTENVERSKDFVLGFGLEGEEGENPYEFRPSGIPAHDNVPPGGLGTIEDDHSADAEETPPVPPRPAPARPERRPSRDSDNDDDDFSNQSSWMTNQ